MINRSPLRGTADQENDEFVGINRRGDTEWKGLVEIIEREECHAYAFVTGGRELNYVHWRYQLEADGEGTRLTEQWALRNLSPIMVEKIFEVVREISGEGLTVLLVEQNARLALQAANRGYVMDSGLVTMSGDAKTMLDDPKVRAAYLGE